MAVRSWLLACLLLATAQSLGAPSSPNFVILFVDDFAWGDVGMNNATVTETANLDRMARGGIRFTDFHAGASVCTPSRATLLTGRLPPRHGTFQNFGVDSLHGLPSSEITVAELLQPIGYATGFVGKWHLGHRPGYHPAYRGFQRVLTVPYSLDMGCKDVPGANLPPESPCPTDHGSCSDGGGGGAVPLPHGPHPPPPLSAQLEFDGDEEGARGGGGCSIGVGASGSPALPLYSSTEDCSRRDPPNCNPDIIEQPVDLKTLADKYAAFATDFISTSALARTPFYLHVAFSHTHVPLATAPRFNGSSSRGVFGDVTMEMDDTVARIWAALVASGVENNTLILATGDNGPWNVKGPLAGSQGPFTGEYQLSTLGGGATGKFTTWEGGHREFGVAYWAGRIAPGRTCNATVSALDWFPTVAALSGAPLPSDRQYDGVDLSPLLLGGACPKLRDTLFHPDGSGNLTAWRLGQYKAYLKTAPAAPASGPPGRAADHWPPLVFDLSDDPSESTPLANISVSRGIGLALMNAWHDKMGDIASSFRSATNYSGGGEAAWSCCNASHVVCRC